MVREHAARVQELIAQTDRRVTLDLKNVTLARPRGGGVSRGVEAAGIRIVNAGVRSHLDPPSRQLLNALLPSLAVILIAIILLVAPLVLKAQPARSQYASES